MLTYALFHQTALKFLKNRGNPDAFEKAPTLASAAAAARAQSGGSETYTILVNGEQYVVEVNEGGDISQVASKPKAVAGEGDPVKAPLSGNIWKVLVSSGQTVQEGDVLLILEAMKMETQIVAEKSGTVSGVFVKPGDTTKVGDVLVTIS